MRRCITLSGKNIDDGEKFHYSSVCRLVEQKVATPDMILMRRLKKRCFPARIALSPLFKHFEPLKLAQPANPFPIHSPPLLAQFICQPAVAIAWKVLRDRSQTL
jgi:hypothetical protein